MLAIIIFGTRGVRSTVKEGNFICPQCISNQHYKHKKVTQFFTLYFIPLIPLGNRGEYVECLGCRNTYITRVLDLQPKIDITEHQDKPAGMAQSQSQVGFAAAAATQNSSQQPTMEPEKNKAIKKVLIMMILADGKIEDSELHVFHRVYKECTGQHVADLYKEIDEVRQENKQPHQYLKEVVSFLNEQGKEDILMACMKIASADGDVDPSELRMVENFGKALELKPAEVARIIESVHQKV